MTALRVTCEFLILSLTSCSLAAESKPEGAAMLSSKGIIVTSAFRLVCPCALSAELRFLVKAQKVLGCSLVGSLGAARPQTNDARLFSGSALSWQYASVLASFIRTCQTYTATWGSTSGKHSLPH
jgi:hypothetical protein